MPRRDHGDDDAGEEYDEEEYDEEEELGSKRRRRASQFIDDVAEEDDDEEDEEEEEDDYEDDARRSRTKRLKSGSQFLDLEAVVDSDDEEEEEEGEDDFINDTGAELQDDDGGRMRGTPLLAREDEQEDVEDLERRIQERYARSSSHVEYDEETTEVEQQALLPSVKDPKLWLVKCMMGHEREAVVCLMQKLIDKGSEVQIRSAIALDHLKNYIYIEADKESHVKEACKGLRIIFSMKVNLVPIKEMTDVLSVESKTVDLGADTWVRMKIGKYKGDLAKVVNVDNVKQRVTVKLIPRVDLQAIASKLNASDIKKKAFVPPPRLMNIDELRELPIRVEHRRDPSTGEYFDFIDNMLFKDGFHYKVVSIKSIHTQNIIPTIDEIEKFQKPGDDVDGDMPGLSTLFANRKKGHFMKGDAVVVVKGDLNKLMGWVEKVDEENVYMRPSMEGLPKILAFKEKELCKYFKPGDHVKVASGAQKGATGMVVKVERHLLTILSDTTKEHISDFADNVVMSSEVTTGTTKIGDYELHDLVLLDNMSFGVIIRLESEAFQVLKGVPERPEVVLVKLREIKHKIDRRANAKDRFDNLVSLKDVVKIIDGPCKGKQGPVEHIYRGILFIHDRHHLEHAGYICAKSQSCVLIGGSRGGSDRNVATSIGSNPGALRPPSMLNSPRRIPRGGPPIDHGGRFRGRRGTDSLVGNTIKIRMGNFKGYRGRVVGVNGSSVRVELESQMKVVTINRDMISDSTSVGSPSRETPRYGNGSETPLHPSRTPMHPFMTPIRDGGATPIHDGMRTPRRDRAWNPYAPMSPARDNWEDGNPATWAASPLYQPGTPPARPYEAPTPGSGWSSPPGHYSEARTPRESSPAYPSARSPYLPSTPGGQPMTPNSASYLPGTPGGQPMTPGNVGLDAMSPNIAEAEGNWFLPDILVNVRRTGEEPCNGIVKEVMLDGSFKVSVAGETIIALPSEMEMVLPKKSDKIKIVGGAHRGATGKLIGIDGTDGIVKMDETLDVKILDMVNLASMAP